MNELIFFSQFKEKLLVSKEDALLFIYVEIDDLLRKNQFDMIDLILKSSFNKSLSTIDFLALLSITFPAKNKLKYRNEFAKYVRRYITERDPNRAEELLSGLE